MQKFVLAAVMLVFAVTSIAEDKPAKPGPEKGHAWLKQLEGEWEADSEMFLEPEKPTKCKSQEKTRMIGALWAVSEGKMDIMGVSISNSMMLGYDAERKIYIGTYVDSMMPHMWKSEGKLDETGKILTLESEGPIPGVPGKTTKFKNIMEIKDKDSRTLTGKILGDDGKWTTMFTSQYRRKK